MRDDRLRDDPVLRQVLLACPPLSAEDLSPTSERATAILDRVLGADVPASGARRASSSRVLFAMGLPLLGVAALVLLIAGVFSGPGGSGAQPALAAVIRHVEQTTAVKPGTIVVSRTRGFSSSPGPGPNPAVVENAWETPAGRGPQNSLRVVFEHIAGVPSETAVSGGEEEVYLSQTNTIYISSIWGHYITKGTSPDTFIYTPPKQPAGSGALPAKPLTLTAAQAHALLDGSDMVVSSVRGSRILHVTLSIAPVPRVPSLDEAVRSLLRSHHVRIVGLTTVDGRRAIELAGPKSNRRLHGDGGADAGVKLWVDPKTYVPIKEVIDDRPFFQTTETWLEYKTLPITPVNERLLSLIARHPHAHIDRNYHDYVKAANGFEVFTP
jgi:hypothetical protein